MPRTSLMSTQILTILATNPPRIATLTADLTPTQVRTRPQPDAWSVHEVLAHLRACADVWGTCMQLILTQDTPTIRAINPTTWITDTDYRDQTFQRSFAAFAAQRTDLLAVLAPLTPDAWARTATVTGAGKPRVRSVLLYAQWLARHERSHLKQVERIVTMLCR